MSKVLCKTLINLRDSMIKSYINEGVVFGCIPKHALEFFSITEDDYIKAGGLV